MVGMCLMGKISEGRRRVLVVVGGSLYLHCCKCLFVVMTQPLKVKDIRLYHSIINWK